MTEDFLHYLWYHRLFSPVIYQTDCGESIEIIDTGIPNTDAGPDFFNAKIKNETTVWAGNVEIHIRSSDWKNHGHNEDPSYDNVILHVVFEHDMVCYNSKRQPVSTIELSFPENYLKNYRTLVLKPGRNNCSENLAMIDTFLLSIWTESLAIERMQTRAQQIEKILISNKYDWEETFYQFMARSFGFGVNSDPFELLAKSVPYKILLKNRSGITDIEALLFGQSGILEYNEYKDEYSKRLIRDYTHLKRKYNLTSVDGFLWKFLRLRPVNFPTIRIAQFSAFIYHTSNIFSRICEENQIENLRDIFRIEPSAYWKDHYLFGKKSKPVKKVMGEKSVESIIINSIAPFLYLYGENAGKNYLQKRSLDILSGIKAENNRIVRKWNQLGMSIDNSFKSQAFIQLEKYYCERRQCLNCMIGHKIIAHKS